MKKIYIVALALLVLLASVTAVSADGFNFNFSSSESSNTDGGSISFENGKLKIQGIELTIPEGYKENETAQKLAEKATDVDGKYSAAEFYNGNKLIIVQVFFDDKGSFDKLTTKKDSDQENKTINGVNGIYFPKSSQNPNPRFEYLKDGKIVSISAPDDDTIAKIMK